MRSGASAMTYVDIIKARVGIPPRTPLVALFEVQDAFNDTAWHLWIAVRDPQAPYSQWQGTYLALDRDGGITRVTIYDDGHEEVMVVK